MKKLTLLKAFFLLCALIVGSSSAWADEEPVVTADFTTAAVGNSNYTNTWTYGDWSLTNCANNNKGWAYIRCGGKGGSSATSTTTSTTTIQGTKKIDYDIKEVKVYHNGTSNNDFTVNSVVLEVSSVSNFSSISNKIELTPTITKETAGTVSFTTGAPYASGSYYRVTINWTVKGKKNYGLDVTKVDFYEDAAAKTATTTTISDANLTSVDLKDGTAAGSLSASVTAGGNPVAGASVSWESSNPEFATIADDGTVTLVAVGTTTITATYAGNDDYYGSSTTYDLEVTDTRTATVTTIDDSSIINTDLKNGTAAGTITASVTAGGDPVLGATVTWESSDPTVATITDGGVVTLVKVGTTTITASYAGGGSYAASSDTYELTVVDSEQKNPVTIQMTNSLFGQDVHTSGGKSTEELTFIGYQDNVKVTYYVPDESYYYFNTSNTRPYNTCTLTYGAPAGYVITKIDFTSDGTNWHDATPSVGEMTDTKTWEGFDQEVTFSWETSGTRVKTVVVTLAEVVTLTPAKTYTTLTSAYALNFTDVSGLEAYIAKDGVSEGSVKMTQVNKVPANTGLVLKATTPNSAVNIPVFDGTGADDVSGNLMVGSATETTAIEKDGGYILSNGVFQPASAGTLAAGKAYLQIAVTSARSLEMSFDDATTAINGIEEVAPVNVKTRKVVKNGRLVIETANGEFTIDGARMK